MKSKIALVVKPIRPAGIKDRRFFLASGLEYFPADSFDLSERPTHKRPKRPSRAR